MKPTFVLHVFIQTSLTYCLCFLNEHCPLSLAFYACFYRTNGLFLRFRILLAYFLLFLTTFRLFIAAFLLFFTIFTLAIQNTIFNLGTKIFFRFLFLLSISLCFLNYFSHSFFDYIIFLGKSSTGQLVLIFHAFIFLLYV